MNWNLFLFFSIYLCSTSQRNAYNLFSALSRLKLPLSLFSFRFAAPCSLHRCSSAFHFRFTYTFVFLNLAFPRATALLLYTFFLILSTFFLVEDFFWILSLILTYLKFQYLCFVDFFWVFSTLNSDFVECEVLAIANHNINVL